MRDRNSDMPVWVKVISLVGVPTFILLWFAGAFGGLMPSPVQAALERHTKEQSAVSRLICEGIWRNDPEKARACYRVPD